MMKQDQVFYYKIAGILRNSLGSPEVLHQSSPLAYAESALEVLLATILTQATSDKNALQAWFEYKKVFPDPEQVLRYGEQRLQNTIRSAGLVTQKARTIISVLQKVKEQWGTCSLDSLKNDPQFARDFLCRLPGVGPKTVACTMLFGLGLPQFPVDVHIQRIVKRLGWIADKTNPQQTQIILSQQIPFELHYDLHILLLNLGRHYCRPHQPTCNSCPLYTMCSRRF